MKIGIPIEIIGRHINNIDETCESNGIALTHAELKELMREFWQASRMQEKVSEDGVSWYEAKHPDFETYYQGRGK